MYVVLFLPESLCRKVHSSGNWVYDFGAYEDREKNTQSDVAGVTLLSISLSWIVL